MPHPKTNRLRRIVIVAGSILGGLLLLVLVAAGARAREK
jgi:hypothetical protein